MNLADMLCYADIAELKKIAVAYDCPIESHSKNELIQSILSTVQRRDVMESRLETMTESELRFLNSLVFETRNAYSLEELKARALDPALAKSQTAQQRIPELMPTDKPTAKPSKRKTKKEPPAAPPTPEETARQSIARFKNNGWLFSGFSQQTRSLFQVPDDIRSRLCATLEKRYRGTLVVVEETRAYRDERGLLADDVLIFLRFLGESEAAITGEGTLYKRQLVQALDQLYVGESLPTQAGWRFGYGRHFRDYPDRFSLLYDYVYSEGFVFESPDGYLSLTPKGNAAVAGGVKPDPAAMYRFWIRLYKPAIPNLPSLAQWASRLSEGWITVESLKRVLLPLIRPFYYDAPEDILEKRVLKMMMHLGIVQWGESLEGEPVVKTTPQGKLLVAGHSLEAER